MASRTRPRAHSETGTVQHDYGQLVSEAFQRYQLPSNLGHEVAGWPAEEGVTRRIQSRFLGLSSLKLTHCTLPSMAFYEITESEISVIASRQQHQHQRQHDLGEEDDKVSLSTTSASSPECVDALLSLAQSSPPPPPPLGDAMILADNPSSTSSSTTRSLPPKKRKRRRVISYNVVFCIPSTINEDLLTLPNPDQEYFIFPRDAVVEAVNQTSTPLEVMFSYHLPQCTIEPTTSSLIHSSSLLHSMCSCRSSTYPSKLEEFATVCSDHLASTNHSNTFLRSQRRFTDPCIQAESCHVLNMRMTGVSKDLYDAMKQVVSNFESVCQRMMDLIRLHTERMNNEKAVDLKQEDQDMTEEEATITTMLTKTQVQSEEEEEVDPMLYDSTAAVATGGGHWSSDEWDKDLDDDQDDTDYCMTSPHSKSTIASTSSHYTAAAAAPPAQPPPPPPVTTTTTTSNTTTETKKGGKSGNGSNGMKKCLYCGSKSTPMWRRGPQGAGTLCNACGVKWKHGKILCGNDAPSQANTTLSSSTSSTQAKESHPRRNSGKGDKRRRKTSSATIKKDKARNKAAQQRKRASIQQKMESDEDDMMTGVQYTFTSPRDIVPESFHHPRYQQQQQQQRMWEPSSSVSSYSHSFEESSCSPPLESFSSSPNSSIHDPMMDKNSSSSSSSSFPLSDAVEAATVLTLLKRS